MILVFLPDSLNPKIGKTENIKYLVFLFLSDSVSQ